ncbi:YwqG family protein [Actinopolyspora sp. H202]|uniref:YwqG family protein n=1 Tax=Actinopolyspora sp. H202 TaxID=1500456 RepID=UPI003EE49186
MTDLERQRERLAQTLREHLDEDEAERITASGSAALELSVTTRHGDPLARSHFGGDALLSPGSPWPCYDEATPLELVAVLDLAEIGEREPSGILPKTGLLNFFHAGLDTELVGLGPEETGTYRVIKADPDTAVATSPPAGVYRYPCRQPRTRCIFTIPCEQDVLGVPPENIPQRYQYAYEALYDEPGYAGELRALHQIGGWPTPIQETMWERMQRMAAATVPGSSPTKVERTEANPDDWFVLAQFDSDSSMDWEWGHAGTLYYMISKTDLRAADFSRAWMQLQC